MAPGYGYNMNMTENPWMMLAQQGLGMLGGSSMDYGVGNFGGLTGMGMGCGNIFTNCYGEPNYDAMLGYGLLKVGSTAAIHIIADGRASRGAVVNYTEEINNINTEINNKNDEITTLEGENTTLGQKISAADKEIQRLTDSKPAAKTALETAEKALDGLKEGDAGYLKAKREYDEALAAYKKIDEDIEAQKKIKKDTNETIQANDEKISKLEAEIKKLEDKKLEYEQAKAQKGGEDCLQTGFYDKEKNPANEKQFKKAMSSYLKAKKENNTDDIKKYAAIIVEMYESNDSEFAKMKDGKYTTLYQEAKAVK